VKAGGKLATSQPASKISDRSIAGGASDFACSTRALDHRCTLRPLAALQCAARFSRISAASTAGIAIAKIEPERPVVPQYAADFAKDLDNLVDELSGRRLEADLACDAIIA
jgi:hypothetical protein